MNQLRYFEEFTKIVEVHRTLPDWSKALATLKGKVSVTIRDEPIILRDLYYVSSLHLIVMSCARLDGSKLSNIIGNETCSLRNREERNSFLGSVKLDEQKSLYFVPI